MAEPEKTAETVVAGKEPAVTGMTKKDGLWMFLIFAVLIVFGIVGHLYQSGDLNALKNFTDKDYVAEFKQQVQRVGSNLFVSTDAYGKDWAKIDQRLKKLEGQQSSANVDHQASVGATATPQPSASAGSSNPVPTATVPGVTAPKASAQSGVPEPSVTTTSPAPGATTTSVPQPSGTAAPPASAVVPNASAGSASQSSIVANVTQEQAQAILQQFGQVNSQLSQMSGILNQLPTADDIRKIVKDQSEADWQRVQPNLLDAPPPPVEPRPRAVPLQRLKTPKPTQMKPNPSVPLHNLNLAQPARLHEEFVEQWVHGGTCYHKFVRKDEQGRIHGQPFSRPVGQQMAYRPW